MKKRLFAILVLASLVLMLAIPALASGTGSYIIDECETMSAARLAELNEKAAGIVNDTGMNVAFVITNKAGEDGILNYIENLYAEKFGGTSGVILGHDVELGKWSAARVGRAAELLTEADEDDLFEAYNQESTYASGVEAYLDLASERIALAINAASMPEDSITEQPTVQTMTAGGARVVDMADLLSDEEEAQLRSQFDAISARHNADVVFVIVNSTGNKSPMEFADDFFDYNGYKKDGILMLVSMQERDWWVSTAGRGITAVTDDALSRYEEESVTYLSYANYYRAASKFGDLSDEFLTLEEQGTPYHREEEQERRSSGLAAAGVVSAGVGLATGAIGTGSMKSKLRSVHSKRSASEYMKRDSLNIVDASEIYLYSNVTRTYIDRDRGSSGGGGGGVHISSSGTSHGGGGGKF